MSAKTEWPLNCRLEDDERCYAAGFQVEVTLTSNGNAQFWASNRMETQTVEISQEVFNSLVQLQIAGQLNAVREIIEDAFLKEDGLREVLNRIADCR